MPAPNIALLYDFESPYEDALTAYFANLNIGGLQFAQVLNPRSNYNDQTFQITPRLQIKAGVVGLQATGSGVQETQVTINNVSSTFYSYYSLSVALDVITQRQNSSQPHGLFRGMARQGMLSSSATLNVNTVPYFQTTFVNPGASNQVVDPDNDTIITSMSYTLDMAIPVSSVPTS